MIAISSKAVFWVFVALQLWAILMSVCFSSFVSIPLASVVFDTVALLVIRKTDCLKITLISSSFLAVFGIFYFAPYFLGALSIFGFCEYSFLFQILLVGLYGLAWVAVIMVASLVFFGVSCVIYKIGIHLHWFDRLGSFRS